jgi:hypothetical protein
MPMNSIYCGHLSQADTPIILLLIDDSNLWKLLTRSDRDIFYKLFYYNYYTITEDDMAALGWVPLLIGHRWPRLPHNLS